MLLEMLKVQSLWGILVPEWEGEVPTEQMNISFQDPTRNR